MSIEPYLSIFLTNYFLGLLLFINLIGGLPGDQPRLFRRPPDALGRAILSVASAVMLVIVIGGQLLSETPLDRSADQKAVVALTLILAAYATYRMYRRAQEEIPRA